MFGKLPILTISANDSLAQSVAVAQYSYEKAMEKLGKLSEITPEHSCGSPNWSGSRHVRKRRRRQGSRNEEVRGHEGRTDGRPGEHGGRGGQVLL